MTFEELQLKELERYNDALANQSIQIEDIQKMNRKVFNPQTGELQLLVDNGNGGVKWASVNIFE
jgi:hypothetical protein